ncbi:hypothetical protein ACFVDI_02060 [Nocardioides sp. NPDC057767]|uniref:DUF7701 domain-containing protein n=1 Tax=unclassified Nocardioides TaxID=2615069 RepID=UPI003670A2E0
MTYLDDIAQTIRESVDPNVGVPGESDDLFRLYAVLSLVKGESVTARDVHDAWVAWMQTKGEEHESMIPFDSLDASTRAEDKPFVDAIHRAVRRTS